MEKRLLIAIVLSFLVLFLYQALFVKKQPPPEPVPEITPETVTETEKKPAVPPSVLQEPESQAAEDRTQAAAPEEFQPVSSKREEQVFVNTSLYRGVWSNKGGVLKSWSLKDYRDNEGEDLELVSRRTEEIATYPFILRSDDPEFDRKVNNALYYVSFFWRL